MRRLTYINHHCVAPENIHTPLQRKYLEILEGWVGSEIRRREALIPGWDKECILSVTVHRHMKTADICHYGDYANAKIPEISVSFVRPAYSQRIRDTVWSWSSYLGQPKFANCFIFDKPIHHCRTSPHLR